MLINSLSKFRTIYGVVLHVCGGVHREDSWKKRCTEGGEERKVRCSGGG